MQVEQWVKPYYYIAWSEHDNAEALKNLGRIGHEPWIADLVWRVFRDDCDTGTHNGWGTSHPVTEPMTKQQAIEHLRKIKLLLREEANYDFG